MKVIELFEIDEWTNKEETIEHLHKVQMARSFEFYLYTEHLCKIYKHKGLIRSLEPLASLPSKQPGIWTSLDIMANKILYGATNVENNKYNKKYDRMIKAKEAYEKVGGKYK